MWRRTNSWILAVSLGHPVGTDPERFHLIAPYESDPRKWLKGKWIDLYSGQQYRITTAGHHGTRGTARAKTYDDILREYEFHAESKRADASGNPCKKQSIGLLRRRHVGIGLIRYIGKESNQIEAVESGLVHSEKQAYTDYPDPRRDEWQTSILAALKRTPLKVLSDMSGISARELKYLRAGHSRPHPRNREVLMSVVRRLYPHLFGQAF